MNTVIRNKRHRLAVPAGHDEYLVALPESTTFVIRHNVPRVALVFRRKHAVRSRLDIQLGTLPIQAVFAGGVANRVNPAGFIPHLENLLFGIPPHTAVFGTCNGVSRPVDLERCLGLQYRVAFILPRQMKRPFQSGLFDKKIIDKELPAHIDGNHGGRMFQIRHGHGVRIVRPHVPRRPNFWKTNAVVKQFAGVFRPRFRHIRKRPRF